MLKSPFLENLKANKKSKEELEEFKKELIEYQELSKDDSNKIGLNVVYFETKGKGAREVLQKIHRCKADTGKIGESWGEIYIYNDEIRLPRKFKINSHRILKRKN